MNTARRNALAVVAALAVLALTPGTGRAQDWSRPGTRIGSIWVQGRYYTAPLLYSASLPAYGSYYAPRAYRGNFPGNYRLRYADLPAFNYGIYGGYDYLFNGIYPSYGIGLGWPFSYVQSPDAPQYYYPPWGTDLGYGNYSPGYYQSPLLYQP